MTGVNNGSGGVETTAGTEQLTADRGPDGAFTAFGGCNRLSGAYQVSGGTGVTISGLASTRKTGAADVDDLGSRYTAALGCVATYHRGRSADVARRRG